MKLQSHSPSLRAAGSALILVLLLIAVAGVLTAGWITLMTARSGMVEQMGEAVQRRIALENSRALAQEFMLERVIPSTSGAAFTCDLSAPARGGISVPAWGSAPLLSVQKAAGVNHFNPGNGDGYTLDIYVTLRDGDADPSRKFQIKSRSPLLAGTLLTSQTPTLTPGATISLGSLNVTGASFFWHPSLSMSPTPNSYSVPDSAAAISFTNSSGSTLAVNNLALPRQVANPRNGGATFYNGEFDAISNTNPAANSSHTKASGSVVVDASVPLSVGGIVSDGLGSVSITLGTPGLGNVYISGGLTTLVLIGQLTSNDAAAANLPALLIVVDQSAGGILNLLSGVTLLLNNSRRLDIAIKKSSSLLNLPVTFVTSSASWRLLLEMENTPASLIATGTVTIQGGIRSDRTIALTAGGVHLINEPDPKNLERLATRTAWVESFAQ